MTQQQIDKIINLIARFLEHKARQGALTFSFQVDINHGGLTAISAKECYMPKRLEQFSASALWKVSLATG